MSKEDRLVSRTYVLGVLGVSPGDDAHIKDEMRFISDFYATREIFGEHPFKQEWLCQFDIASSLERLPKHPSSTSTHALLHDPPTSNCLFLRAEPFYSICKNLKASTLIQVVSMASMARREDHIVLAFFGHGQSEGDGKGAIQLGRDSIPQKEWLYADDVEDFLQAGEVKARVTIITTSCLADWQWLNGPWALVAASRRSESPSLPASISDREFTANESDTTFHIDACYDQHLVFKHEHFLSVPHLEDKIAKLAAQMQRTTSDEVIVKIHPPISINNQRTCLHTTPKIVGQDYERIQKAGPVDSAKLDGLLSRWRETSAGTLSTHSHTSMANLVHAFDRKELSIEEAQILFTSLLWREVMEQRAEQVLASFDDTKGWISFPCRTYTELQGYIDTARPHLDLEYGQILWGSLDELDLKALGAGGTIYRKPSQWVWQQWKGSGSDITGLQTVLSRLKGRIHYFN